MYNEYVAFATVDPKTQVIKWLGRTYEAISSLEHNDRITVDELAGFVTSHGEDCAITQFTDIQVFTYKANIQEHEFIKTIRQYFEYNCEDKMPLTEQEKKHLQEMLLNPNEQCQHLMTFSNELLGSLYHIIFLDEMYYLIGIEEELFNYKSDFWKLGRTLEEAKEVFIKKFLEYEYIHKDLPYQYRNALEEASYHYLQYLRKLSSLNRSLNVNTNDVFYTRLQEDFRHDGGINAENMVFSYWVDKKINQALKQYKLKGHIKGFPVKK